MTLVGIHPTATDLSMPVLDLAREAVLVAALTIDDPQAGGTAEAVSAAKILADDAATQGGR